MFEAVAALQLAALQCPSLLAQSQFTITIMPKNDKACRIKAVHHGVTTDVSEVYTFRTGFMLDV